MLNTTSYTLNTLHLTHATALHTTNILKCSNSGLVYNSPAQFALCLKLQRKRLLETGRELILYNSLWTTPFPLQVLLTFIWHLKPCQPVRTNWVKIRQPGCWSLLTYHKSFEIWPEESPCHTSNKSMSAHKCACLGFNITQLSTKVTNMEIVAPKWKLGRILQPIVSSSLILLLDVAETVIVIIRCHVQ